jgi:hypothetical protein
MSSASARAFGSGFPSRRRKRIRRLAFRLAIIGVMIVAVCMGVTHYRTRDYLPYFREHKGRLVSSVVSPPEPRGDGAIHRVTLQNDRGLEVDAFVKIPRASAAPRAAIVTLGGLRGGVHALEYVEDTGDFIVLAMDYPFEGRRSKLSAWEVLRQVPAMRRAVLDTPSATMLGVEAWALSSLPRWPRRMIGSRRWRSFLERATCSLWSTRISRCPPSYDGPWPGASRRWSLRWSL